MINSQNSYFFLSEFWLIFHEFCLFSNSKFFLWFLKFFLGILRKKKYEIWLISPPSSAFIFRILSFLRILDFSSEFSSFFLRILFFFPENFDYLSWNSEFFLWILRKKARILINNSLSFLWPQSSSIFNQQENKKKIPFKAGLKPKNYK